jgi:hypothetical protein
LLLFDVVKAEDDAFHDFFETAVKCLETTEVEVLGVADHAAVLVEN